MPTRRSPAKKSVQPWETDDLDDLRAIYTTLYSQRLPKLAAVRSSVQKSGWPVHLDHCFGRIILDYAIGYPKDRPWHEVLKKPAIRNMSRSQLVRAVEVGEGIEDGTLDLHELDRLSLQLRGKRKGRQGAGANVEESSIPRKRSKKAEVTEMWSRWSATTNTWKDEKGNDESNTNLQKDNEEKDSTGDTDDITARNGGPYNTAEEEQQQLEHWQALIADNSGMSHYRKHVLHLLTLVPRGRYTTYRELAHAAHETDYSPATRSIAKKQGGKQGQPAARAVGSAMRNNPYAPRVPCHRVLAADRKLGGYGGGWGEEGRFAAQKQRLLREEGVNFDAKGKAIAEPFKKFV